MSAEEKWLDILTLVDDISVQPPECLQRATSHLEAARLALEHAADAMAVYVNGERQ